MSVEQSKVEQDILKSRTKELLEYKVLIDEVLVVARTKGLLLIALIKEDLERGI